MDESRVTLSSHSCCRQSTAPGRRTWALTRGRLSVLRSALWQRSLSRGQKPSWLLLCRERSSLRASQGSTLFGGPARRVDAQQLRDEILGLDRDGRGGREAEDAREDGVVALPCKASAQISTGRKSPRRQEEARTHCALCVEETSAAGGRWQSRKARACVASARSKGLTPKSMMYVSRPTPHISTACHVGHGHAL